MRTATREVFFHMTFHSSLVNIKVVVTAGISAVVIGSVVVFAAEDRSLGVLPSFPSFGWLVASSS